MNKDTTAKLLGAIGVIVLMLAFIGMAFTKISFGWFWAAVVFAAFLGFIVIPRIKGESNAFLDWLQPKN